MVFSKSLIFLFYIFDCELEIIIPNWSVCFPFFNSIFWGVWSFDIEVRFSTPYCHKLDFVELWGLSIWIKWNPGLEFGFGIWVFCCDEQSPSLNTYHSWGFKPKISRDAIIPIGFFISSKRGVRIEDWGGERKSEERRKRKRRMEENEGWLGVFKNWPFCPQSHGEHMSSYPKK